MRGFVGRVAAQVDARMQRDAGHRHLAVGALLEHAFGLIDIAVDHQPRAPREVDEEQHVARRQRGDERFLRIDPAGSDHGAGTMCGLALAGTTAPPSNAHSCARLYWPLAKSPSPVRLQRMVAV